MPHRSSNSPLFQAGSLKNEKERSNEKATLVWVLSKLGETLKSECVRYLAPMPIVATNIFDHLSLWISYKIASYSSFTKGTRSAVGGGAGCLIRH